MLISKNPTGAAFFWTRILNVPFWIMFNLLPIILYRDLNISPWMVTLMVIIKPTSALLASYWSTWIHDRPNWLIRNIVYANLLRYIPFLFIPWIDSPLVFIACFGFYMMLSRGVIPAWMEIFKLNLENQSRSRIFAYGSALDYFFTALLPIGLGLILDDYSLSWRLLLPATAILGLASTLFLYPVRLEKKEVIPSLPPQQTPFSFKEQVLLPWKNAFKILKSRPDFFAFQWGFMLGGAGLMVYQPIIPIFFVDVLNLSYTKMLLAMAVCKALGYAAASPTWVSLFHKWNIYKFSGSISLTSALFPLLIIGSQFHIFFIYIAYILYGVMQAGSELSWHMSGPLFAKEHESSPYSTVNILLVGIRGCFAPLLGSLLYSMTNSATALIAGTMLCLCSSLFLFLHKGKVQTAS